METTILGPMHIFRKPQVLSILQLSKRQRRRQNCYATRRFAYPFIWSAL